MPDRTCLNPSCGVPIVEKKRPNGPWPSYCSTGCRDRASYRRRKMAGLIRVRPSQKMPNPLDCSECGDHLEVKRSDALTCSKRCQTRRLDRLNPLRCSADVCDRGVRAKGLCMMHWRRLARLEGREAAPAWNDQRRANWKKRKALEKGAVDAESFHYRDVFDRDGWVCGICCEPVDPDIAWPDPMSVSLDHVVPLAKGGSHTLANAQCAHLTCNVRKGDRVA